MINGKWKSRLATQMYLLYNECKTKGYNKKQLAELEKYFKQILRG